MKRKKPARTSNGSLSRLESKLRKLTDSCEELSAANANLRLLSNILLVSVVDEDLVSVIKRVLKVICQSGAWDFALCWVPGAGSAAKQEALRLLAFQGSGAGARAIEKASSQIAFLEGQGCPGRAWQAAKPVSFPNLDKRGLDARFADGDLPAQCALSFPVYADGTLVAVIELLAREPKEVDRQSLSVFKQAAPHIATLFGGQAMSQDRQGVSQSASPGASKSARQSARPAKDQAQAPRQREFSGDVPILSLDFALADAERAGTDDAARRTNEDLIRQVVSLSKVNQELQELTFRQDQDFARVLESARLKSEFVANISHEIRTPLSAVIGMSEILLESGLPADSENIAHLVKDSAESLLAIINDILDFSKIEAGRVELETVVFDVGKLVEKVMDLFAHASVDKGVTLLSYVDPQLPRWLCGDPLRLRQVLINLASNAVKFTNDGEVIVSVNLTGQHQGRLAVTLAVSDTGIGISENTMNRLFQPFMQADGSVTRHYGGTGLGLAISKRLVQLMGGDITCVSEPGKGACFAFTLEMEPGEPNELEEPDLPSTHFSLPSVALIVIANETIREVVEKYLRHYGVMCSIAQDCSHAFAEIVSRGSQPDKIEVVLTDCPEELLTVGRAAVGSANGSINWVPMVIVQRSDEAPLSVPSPVVPIAHLPLPFKRDDLLGAISQVILPDSDAAKQAFTVRHSPSEESFKDAVILVVEDNAIMQDLSVRQLKRMGIAAHVAFNGREAVELFMKNRYDLVLMDCQMPEMDGFEATRAMRLHEARQGSHTPIIAVTAGAMREDQDRCLSSGMDEYLVKPISQQLLRAVVTKWLTGEGVSEASSAREIAAAQTGLASSLPGRIDLLRIHYEGAELLEILKSFQEECAELVESLHASVRARDSALTDRTAHQLKGLVSMIHAADMEEQCRRLQAAAVTRHWEVAETTFDQLQHAHFPVRQMIDNYLKQGGG